MADGTFTLSNLGGLGVTSFTAIITPPQVAILATGVTEQRAVVRDGQVVVADDVRHPQLGPPRRGRCGRRPPAGGPPGTPQHRRRLACRPASPPPIRPGAQPTGRHRPGPSVPPPGGRSDAGRFARVDITPPLPVDVLGYLRRPVAPRRVIDPLLITGVVIVDGQTTIAIMAADLTNLTPPFGEDRSASRPPRASLARTCCSTPRTPTPGRGRARSSSWAARRTAGRTSSCAARSRCRSVRERRGAGASADVKEARISGGVGHAPGIAVNRRERTADGRTILGWNPDGFF